MPGIDQQIRRAPPTRPPGRVRALASDTGINHPGLGMNEDDCEHLAQIAAIAPATFPGGSKAYMAAINALHGVEECVAQGLSRSLATGDHSAFLGYLLAAYSHPSPLQTPSLGHALSLRTTDLNCEDIVEVLEVIRDPASVPYLVDALLWQPDWDDYHHFGRKCILALGAIGTADAVQALRDAAAVGPLEIREAATRELQRLGFGASDQADTA